MGSDQCIECHRPEAEAWATSHHALAWTEIEAGHIVADFDGTRFDHDGMSVEFSVASDGPRANVTEKDGVTTEYGVHSVVGIEPLQQYLLETEPGRLQSFDVVWDTEARQWFHLYPDQDLPPDDGLHWTGPYKNWNARCAECHATGFEKNYDAQTRSYASTQSEIGVGCEACHGPGSAHIDWTQGQTLAADLSEFGFTISWGRGRTEGRNPTMRPDAIPVARRMATAIRSLERPTTTPIIWRCYAPVFITRTGRFWTRSTSMARSCNPRCMRRVLGA